MLLKGDPHLTTSEPCGDLSETPSVRSHPRPVESEARGCALPFVFPKSPNAIQALPDTAQGAALLS